LIFYPLSVKIMLKRTKNRLTAGLCADPLGSFSAPPDPLTAIRGPISKGRGEGRKVGERVRPQSDFLAMPLLLCDDCMRFICMLVMVHFVP